MRIFLSGPMGAGKTSVAHAIAARGGLRAVDLDERVESRAGLSIAEIFRTRGEPVFRELEREEARVVADEDQVVVALGGGTVADRDVRRHLLERGLVVTLAAPVSVLVTRVLGGRPRPLLGDDAAESLTRILGARREAYAECHARIDTSSLTPDAIAERVLAIVSESPVVVPLGERTYTVEIGAGMRTRVAERAMAAASGELVVLVTDGGALPWAVEAEGALRGAGRRVVRVELERGEEHKTVAAAERVWDAALAAGADRDALVLAVGGGVVGDVAGFAASTLLRGVAFGQVPTTLLAMVDSAVGGKTGVDRAQGKNLVGTFHQPRFVLCDPDVLATLDPADRRAGLAEVVKAAWIEGELDVSALEKDADDLARGETCAIERAVRRAVLTKALVVTADEREGGERRLLNLGHTIGHALEAAAGFRGIRHGEAVALGLVAAMRVGRALGRAQAADASRMEALLQALELPVDLDTRLARGDVLGAVASDKKRAGGQILFVVPGPPGQVEVVPVALGRLAGLLAPT